MTSSKFGLVVPAILLLSLPVLAQSARSNRIVAAIDPANRVALQGNVHPLAQARFDRGPAQGSNPTGRVALLLQRSAQQQKALTQYLAEEQNPASPNYHNWLTPAQYGAQYGISDADLATVESWLQGQGFRVDEVSSARNVILFSGTVKQIQAAFHTAIHRFQVNGQTHLANVTDPQIPAALAPVIAGIGPLNGFHAKPNVVRGPHARWDATTHTFRPDLTVTDNSGTKLFIAGPSDAAIIYNSPNKTLNPSYSGTNYDGTGVNIGLVGVSDLTMADVANYRMAFLGETSSTVKQPTVVVDGNDPGLVPGGAADEALLDNEIAGALAPKANIYFYTAADTDLTSGLIDAELRAINDNTVSIVSMSFGACEADLGTGGNQVINEMAQQAAAQGISLVVSAGDNGSAGCDDFNTEQAATGGFGVNGFASTPYTIAVGGTDFDVLATQMSTYVNTGTNGSAPYWATARGYIPEAVWNDSSTTNGSYKANVAATDSQGRTNIVAGSGGVSAVYSKPSFQVSGTPADNTRDLPDVSLFSADGGHSAYWALCSDSTTDGATGTAYTECANGSLTSGIGGAGGTSAAAPAFAGMLALISQSQGGARLGQANYVLYQLAQSHTSAFHDLTTSNNSVPCVTASANCGTNGFLTGYDAVNGYDTATGLGSVDLAVLISNWTSDSLTSTTTTLEINGSSAAYTGVHGASLTFNAGVDPTSATGSVAVITTANMNSGGTLNNGQFSIPLTSGTGTATYNGLPGGTYTVSARYSGDTSNASSTSSPVSVTISPEASTTVLNVNGYNSLTGAAVSTARLPYGTVIFADARIEGTAEGSNTQGLATGSVTFTDNGATLGSAQVGSDNLASWPNISGKWSVPSAGSHSFAATYSGDASYKASTSTAVAVTVAQAATTLTVSNAPTSVTDVYGGTSSISFSVTIATPYNLGTAPTGTLTVTANGQPASTLTNLTASVRGSGSSAAWVISATGLVPDTLFQSGSNAILASYGGDANYAASSQTFNITDTDGIGSFTMTGSGDIALVAGLQGDERLTFTPSGGFDDAVGVSVTGVPTGVTVSGSAALGAFSNGKGAFYLAGSPTYGDLLVSTAFNMVPGTYPITVTATDPTGKDLQSITFNLVISAIPSNAAITATNGGAVSMPAGALANNTAIVTITPVNQYIGELNITCTVTTTMAGTSAPPTCGAGSTVLDITSSSPTQLLISLGTSVNTTPGSYTVTFTATDRYNAAVTATTSFPLTIAPAMGVSISNSGNIVTSPSTAGGNSTTLTITPTGGFLGTVTMQCYVSSPADFACAVNPFSVNIGDPSPVTTTLTATAYPTAAPGSYTIRVIYNAIASDGTFQSSTTVGVTIQNTEAFGLSSSGNITLSPGATTGNTATVTVTPSNGFGGGVYLFCSLTNSPAGATDLPTCSIPPSVTIIGTTAATATLTVTTTAPSSASLDRPLVKFFVGGGALFAAVFLFSGIPARRRAWRAMLTLLAIMTVTSAILACSGGGGSSGGGGGGSGGGGGGQTNPGTTPGTYTITVKAADAARGDITASTNVTLTVK